MSASEALVLTIDVGASTDVGLRREVNEDSLLAAHPVYAIADGMGGHEAGDRASRAVVDALAPLVGRDELQTEDAARAIETAHASVRAIADASARGAGSTLAGTLVIEQSRRAHWLVFNIGDSRVYRYGDGVLTQLTVDHSVAQQMVEDGRLAREDVGTFTGRNVITKAVGADDSAADYWLYPVVAGEKLLVCSDGLTGEVDDTAIAAILALASDAQSAADRLVEASLASGGRDNVSVIVLDVVAGGIAPDLDESTRVVGGLAVEPADLDENTREVPRASRGGRG